MKRSQRTLLAGLVALSLFGSPAWAQEGGNGGANLAVAINTKDGATVFKLAFDIRRVMGDVVDEANAAVAFANCEACRTVAIAIQTVLVFSDPSVVTPENLAIAINQECIACETMAFAYQFVLGTDGPVRFTRDGNQALADIRQQLKDLRDADLAIEELQAQLDEIVGQLQEVIATELVPIGRKEEEPVGPEGADQGLQDPTASPTPGEPPSPSASPEASPTPEVTLSPSPTPTPTPTPS
jgi:putative peptide zinc metalloprotease protein